MIKTIEINFRYGTVGLYSHKDRYFTNEELTKSTKWHVRPAKTQIGLGIRPV